MLNPLLTYATPLHNIPLPVETRKDKVVDGGATSADNRIEQPAAADAEVFTPSTAEQSLALSPAEVFTSCTALDMASLPINRLEMTARYTNNMLIHLLASDGAALLSIAANLTTLPPFLAPLVEPFNAVNSVTGILGIAADLREMRGTFRNENATTKDRAVDVAHFVLGDVVSTAASMVPMVMPLTNPIAMGFFVGGQLMGLAMDVHKCAYDISRKGQQSAGASHKPVPEQPAPTQGKE